MTDDNEILRDKDGYVYDKQWHGGYEKQWSVWNQDHVRDDAERDWKPSKHTDDGTALYRQRESSGGSSSSSSGAGDAASGFIALLMLALVLSGIALAFTPVAAPLILIMAESDRKRGNMPMFNKWQKWGRAATFCAFLVVLILSLALGFGASLPLLTFAEHVSNTTTVVLIQLLALIAGIVVLILSFTTGIAPTAVVYFKYEEAHFIRIGELSKAGNIKRLYMTIAITAGICVSLTLIGLVGLYITAMVQPSLFNLVFE